jgi:SAM-dependent methyltransferase
MTDGWDNSAQAWITSLGSEGDWSRRHVLDAPMRARVSGRGFDRALDLGCGEGRFCRLLQGLGIATVGIDPTTALIEHARRLDPAGDYRLGRAEALDIPDASVDLVVGYLSLIDIPDLPAAICEVKRVLRPGGSFLIANLQGFNTASIADGWTHKPDRPWDADQVAGLQRRQPPLHPHIKLSVREGCRSVRACQRGRRKACRRTRGCAARACCRQNHEGAWAPISR